MANGEWQMPKQTGIRHLAFGIQSVANTLLQPPAMSAET
jgi:hypothetical protein